MIFQSLKDNLFINNFKIYIMTLDEFVKAFAAEFDDTPEEQFTPSTNYR